MERGQEIKMSLEDIPTNTSTRINIFHVDENKTTKIH